MAEKELFGNSEQLNDTISRAAALDALENIDCSDGVGISSLKCDAVEDAVIAIKALPSAQPTDAEIQRMQDIEQAMLDKAYECGKQDAQRWIPCGERLPEPGVNVLVDVLDIPADDRFPLVDKIGDDGDWCNCYGEWFAVAWVPIPDPWEGGNDG